MTELKFRTDKAIRDRFFDPKHFAHPAKMLSQLQLWIIEHYTKAGSEHIFTDEMLKEADKIMEWCQCSDNQPK